MDTLDSVIDKINTKLIDSPLFYLSNDPERGIGLEGLLNNYHLAYIDVSHYTDYFKEMSIKHFCLENYRVDGVYRSSGKLIKSPEFIEYFNHHSQLINYFQTFKISSQFEFATNKIGAKLLNTKSELNRLFEDKISQFKEISDIGISLPKTIIGEIGGMEYSLLVARFGSKMVIQFDRGHTGSGTVFVDSENDFKKIKEEFPMRHVRISEMINGRAYTLNACVGEMNTYIGGLSAQITGVDGLTPQKGATIGNDWEYRADLVNGHSNIILDTYKIADKMRKSGYRGLFGVDLIVMPTGEHKIIEINARQPASIPMYTKIQLLSGQIPLAAIHLMEFLGIEYDISSVEYNMVNTEPQAYSQVFVRPLTDMTINQEIKMGVYSMHGESMSNENVIYIDEEADKSIRLERKGYSIEQIQEGGLLLLSQKKGRLIKKNTELSRIQLKQPALDASGNLKPWIKEVLLAIKEYQI